MANPFINLKKQQDEDNKQEQPKATTGNPFVDLPKQPAQQPREDLSAWEKQPTVYEQRKARQEKASDAAKKAWWEVLGLAAQDASAAATGQQRTLTAEEGRQRATAGANLAAATKENREANKIIDWDGRKELLKQYEASGGTDMETREKLRQGDIKAGNIAADGDMAYTLDETVQRLGTSGLGNIASGVYKTALTLSDLYGKSQAMQGPTEDELITGFLTGQDPTAAAKQRRDAYNSKDVRDFMNARYGEAAKIAETAKRDLQIAKENKAPVVKAGIDLGENMLEMGFDGAVATLTGGSALIPMAIRVFGNAALEAQEAGASLEQQTLYGLGSAAVEVFTEKMGDGLAGLYGKGFADSAMEKLIGKLAKTDNGRTFLRFLSGLNGEGVEEVVSGLFEPALKSIYNGRRLGENYSELELSNLLYDYALGAAAAMFGGVSNIASGGNAYANAQLRAADAAQAQTDQNFGWMLPDSVKQQATEEQFQQMLQPAPQAVQQQAPQEAAEAPAMPQGAEIPESTAEAPTAAPVELNSQERAEGTAAPVETATKANEADIRKDPRTQQLLNIYISNIVNSARKNGVNLSQYYNATQGMNGFSVSSSDAQTIVNELAPVVQQLAAKGDAQAERYLNAIREKAGVSQTQPTKTVAPAPVKAEAPGSTDPRAAEREAAILEEMQLESGLSREAAERMVDDRYRSTGEYDINKILSRPSGAASTAPSQQNIDNTAPAAAQQTPALAESAQQTQTEERAAEDVGPYEGAANQEQSAENALVPAGQSMPEAQSGTGTEARGDTSSALRAPSPQGEGSAEPAPMRPNEPQSPEDRQAADERYNELGERYGTIEPGENPARESAVPKQIDDQRKVGKTARTMYEAAAIPDNRLDDIRNAVVDGKFSYITISNKALATEAENRVKRDGWDAALRDFLADVRSGKTGDRLEALGAVLINNAANSGMDGKAFVDLAMAYDQLTHNTARGLAAARILKSLTPTAQIYRIQKTVNRMNDELQELRGKKEAKEQKKEQKALEKAKKSALDKTENELEDPTSDAAKRVADAIKRDIDRSKAAPSKEEPSAEDRMAKIALRLARERLNEGKAKPKVKTATDVLREIAGDEGLLREIYELAQAEFHKEESADYAEGAEPFTNAPPGLDRARGSTANKLFARAIAESAARTGENTRYIMNQSALGISSGDIAEAIAKDLIRQTGASNDLASSIREGCRNYVNEVLQGDSKVSEQRVSALVTKQMRAIGKSFRELATQDGATRDSVRKDLADMIAMEFAVGPESAKAIADVVAAEYDKQLSAAIQTTKDARCVNPAKDNVPWFMWAEKSGQAVADSMAKKLKEAGITKPVKVKTVAQQAEADIKKVLRAYSHTKSRNINAEALENILNNPQFANDLYQELRESLVKKSKLSEEEIADLGEDWIQESLYDVLAQMAGKSNEIHLDEKLVDEFLKADSDESRDEILDRIKQNIADQIPPTFRDKFVALRYLNMLGNFKTPGRNVFGNVFMITTAMLKNHIVRGTMEGIAQAASGGKYQANTSVFYNPALLKETMADFGNVEKIALGEQKYGDVGSNYEKDIDEKRRIFRSRTLEGYRKLTKWAMEAGDKVFSKAAYADAMAGWMQAHKVKHISDMTPEMLDRARAFAIKEAQEATFRDSNKFSNWASSIGRGENVPAAVKAVAEGTLPFRKTPANVLARAFEYSPAGVFSVIEKSIQAAKGNATGSDVVNALSKSFTGTGLFAVGMLLKAIGSLRTRDDDEQLENFHKDQGMQNYSLVLPDGKTVTLDWVAPASIPLFMGATFQQIREEGGISGDNLLSVVTQLTEPMLEMSMLSGVNDALELSTGYGNNRLQALPSLCLNALAGYMTQGLGNSLIRQGEQAWEKNRRTSYTDSSLPIPTALQRKGSQLFSGIPGMDIQQQDYIDVWGRKQDQGSTGERILQSFFNPAYIGKDRSTKYDGELERLYKAGFKAALPKAPERSTDVNGERLTPEEYQTYAEKAGKKKLELIGDFLDSEEYKKLSDEDREAVISNLYSYANHLAAKDIVKMRGEKMKETSHVKSMEKLRELDKNGGSAVDYLLAKQGLKTAVDAKDYSGVDALLGDVDKMDKATKEQLFADVNRLDDRVEAHKAGIDTKLWEAVYAQKKRMEDDKSTTAVQDVISMTQYLDGQKGLNQKQKDLLREQMGFYTTFRAEADKFDQMTGAGLSADKSGTAWNTIHDLKPLAGKSTVSAAQKVQAISGMRGFSDAEKWTVFACYLQKSNESLYKKAMKAKDSGKSFDQWAKEYAGSSGSSSGSDALSFITGGGSSGSSSGSSSGGDALSFITGGRG